MWAQVASVLRSDNGRKERAMPFVQGVVALAKKNFGSSLRPLETV